MTILKVCTDSFGNIGSQGCQKNNPFTDAVSLIIATKGFEFASFTSFATQADWETAIKAKQVFPLHGIVEFEDQSEDVQYYETASGVRIPRRQGKYRYMYMYNLPLEVHKALQTFRNASVEVFVVDSAGNVSGYSPDGVKVKGMSVGMINPEKMKPALQDNTPAFSPLAIDMADEKQWNEQGVFVTPGWSPLLLEPVSSVELSVVSATATNIVIKVGYFQGIAPDGSDDLVGISGIEEADFVWATTNPDPGMTDNGDGTYAFSGTGMVSGTVDLKPPSTAVSAGPPIENTEGPVPVTIS